MLEQRFSQTQQERDDLYKKFIKAINEVQQKTGFKNALLEKKLRVMEEAVERKVSLKMCVQGKLLMQACYKKRNFIIMSSQF